MLIEMHVLPVIGSRQGWCQ